MVSGQALVIGRPDVGAVVSTWSVYGSGRDGPGSGPTPVAVFRFSQNLSLPRMATEVAGTTTTDGPPSRLTALQARADLTDPYD